MIQNITKSLKGWNKRLTPKNSLALTYKNKQSIYNKNQMMLGSKYSKILRIALVKMMLLATWNKLKSSRTLRKKLISKHTNRSRNLVKLKVSEFQTLDYSKESRNQNKNWHRKGIREEQKQNRMPRI